MRLLARREYSVKELTDRLSARGHEAGEVAAALQQLADKGLQSDERFAACLLRDRLLRGQGPRKMLAELDQRGVDRQLASQSLAELESDQGIDWVQQALSVLQRRFGSVAPEAMSPRERARHQRFLASRGFDFEQVRRAVQAWQKPE